MSWRWILLMAWRDSRRSRSRLFLYIASIILGISAFVAMDSFKSDLRRNIDSQAAELLGADLELSARTAPSKAATVLMDSITMLSEQAAKEERFVSMLRFSRRDESRLIQVRGLSSGYPFYGEVETQPKDAFQLLADPSVLLLENELMLQFDAQVGDSVQIGEKIFTIGGSILKMAGRTSFASSMAPSAVMSLEAMAQTALKQTGSRVEYFYYFKMPTSFPTETFIDEQEERFEETQLRVATVASTKENTGRSFADVTRFMQLVGFAALLLGAIGVSSAVHVYVQEKMVTVATLRCLGATAKKTFAIFFVQFACIGLIAGLCGAVLGILIQYLLPFVMQEFLPVALSASISWGAVLQGIFLGFSISVLFALLPLANVRRVSPLNTLRVVPDVPGRRFDGLQLSIYLLIILFLVVFSRLQLEDWIQTLFFVLGIVITFALLYGTASLLMFLVRRFFPRKWPYVWRQGLSNLFRPRNQTTIIMLSVGFGTALIAILFFVQDMLLTRVNLGNSADQANVVLFDIQPAQRPALKTLIEKQGLPVMEEVPIVTLQLSEINGHALHDVVADSTLGYSANAFKGEVRATYRDSLADSETLVAGKWVSEVTPLDTAQVSLEEGYAKRLGVKVGDTLLLNVQGLLMPAKVASFRRVDWNRFQTNFRMVFAKGSLEAAPQFYVFMTRTADESQSAGLQRDVVRTFPNVSIVDLHSLIAVLNELLDKIGFVIAFIGSFSIFTGIVVLLSSLLISKFQRLKENVLLRTLGATKKQIGYILLSEYLFLGLFAALTGILIAVIATNVLAAFVFEAVFVPSLLFIVLLLFGVTLITVLIGVFNSLGLLNKPTLTVLRAD
ncbi:ABC transporter permease [Sphingobacterium paludis]|uniref:Putative ABC transport system permease protein n=1 Tax=Sphingobacterium paludis TaxID=1476465 RepID=A0A4R7DA03_9SPHI|nr:FtsX-like permease family protein [Sphingobacterium paludis]TDS17627.1 putative ABC transport system permease protein [Sphingobacterium paludis]